MGAVTRNVTLRIPLQSESPLSQPPLAEVTRNVIRRIPLQSAIRRRHPAG